MTFHTVSETAFNRSKAVRDRSGLTALRLDLGGTAATSVEEVARYIESEIHRLECLEAASEDGVSENDPAFEQYRGQLQEALWAVRGDAVIRSYEDLQAARKAVIDVIDTIVSRNNGETLIHPLDPNAAPAFTNTRCKASEKETQAPYGFICGHFGADPSVGVLLTDRQLIDAAVETLKQDCPDYSEEMFIREALRSAAQSVVATWAAREVRLEDAKGEIRTRSGSETYEQIRRGIEELREARESAETWNVATGGNIPIITTTYVMRAAKVGMHTVRAFLRDARNSSSTDQYADVYHTYREFRDKGSNPAHAVKAA